MAVLPTGIGPVTGGYQIERSLRFNSADSAYLNRTPGSASNRRTFTWSGWVKRGSLTTGTLFSGGATASDAGWTGIWWSSDTIRIGGYNTVYRQTTAVYRDPSAWYHVIVVMDTTQATANNRVRLYVNGTEVTVFTTTNNPTQNSDLGVNQAARHDIGYESSVGAGTGYYNGYLTEINFIDGQALTPSSFGETDSATGVWKPKAYSGTYGTNGFFLKFADNSGTTSTTLGKDYSGNGNNWTPNNFSVTAGVGNDSLVDSPTSYGTDIGVGGEVRGNYPTLNPLSRSSGSVITNGNLDWSSTTYNYQGATSTICLPSSGKWYWETDITTGGPATSHDFGVGVQSLSFGTFPRDNAGANGITDGAVYVSRRDTASRLIVNNSIVQQSNTYSFSTGDVVQVAYDASTGKIWFGRNNTWWDASGGSTGNPSSGTNPVGTLTAGGLYLPVWDGYTNAWVVAVNFGQRAFAYTAPSGFKALCTTNLPTPTIGATSTTQANKYFNPVLYTGTGSTRDVTGVGFSPDLVWVKRRSAIENNLLANTISGGGKSLYSNLTLAEQTNEAGGYISAFVSDGFTVTAGSSSSLAVNASGGTYVAWNWNAGGSTVTNTSGTISAQVRANTTSGFSIVTYTGTGANATVGHGLGVAPQMVIVKSRSGSGRNWCVYNANLTSAAYAVFLERTDAQAIYANVFNSTAPTSSVFSIGTNAAINTNTETYVAYCFAPVAGYSAFGSYTGNGSTDGPFVYTGFRPEFVMVKRTDSTESWYIIDAVRDPYNVSSLYLAPNGTDAEASSIFYDLVSNGFKLRTSAAYANASGGTYIYAAFAESPFKYSLAR
jgi:hypothetical protein